MRHRVKGKKLNRDVKHRRALYKNLVSSLLIHGQIETTQAKAKAIQGTVDKLFTKAKKGDLHNRRLVERFLTKTTLVNQLVDEIAPKTGKRVSGFTRIIKLGRRASDDTLMVRMELVDGISPALDKGKKPVKEKAASQKEMAKKEADKKPVKRAGGRATAEKMMPVKDQQKPQQAATTTKPAGRKSPDRKSGGTK